MATKETVKALEELAKSTRVRDGTYVIEPVQVVDRGINWDSSGNLTQSYNAYAAFQHDRYVSDNVPDRKGDFFTVLDLGCGEGRFLTQLRRLNGNIAAFGITLHLYPTALPRKRIILGDLSNILEKIPDRSIDLIASVQCLCYAHPGTRYFLQEIHRILSPQGLARIQGPKRYVLQDQIKWAKMKEYLIEFSPKPNNIITMWKPGTPDFRKYETPTGG